MRTNVPSERNAEIYHDVEFGGLSLRKAAEKHQMSPTRVQQIVAEMRDWFRATTPAWVEETQPHLQPLVACRMAQERLRFLYRESVEAWHDSQGVVTITREGGRGPSSSVTTRSSGQPRYLMVAGRLTLLEVTAAERLAKIAAKASPPPAAVAPAPVMEAAAEETPLDPPEIGCALSSPVEAESPADEDELSAVEDSDCDVVDRLASVPMNAAPQPVRAAMTKRQERKERRKVRRKTRVGRS